MADELLTKAILSACPELRSLMAEQDAVEDRMVKAIQDVQHDK